MKNINLVVFSCVSAAILQMQGEVKRFIAADESQGYVRYVDLEDSSAGFSIKVARPVWDLKKIGEYRYRTIGDNGFDVVDLAKRKVVDSFRHKAANGITAVCDLQDGGFVCICDAKRDVRMAVFNANRVHMADVYYRGIYYPRTARNGKLGTINVAHEKGFSIVEAPSYKLPEPNGAVPIVEGNILRTFTMPKGRNAYDMFPAIDGDGWLMSAGYGSQIVRFTEDGTIKCIFEPPFKDGKPGLFYAQLNEFSDGRLLMANWNGHRATDGTLNWQLVEFDKDGNVLWHFHRPEWGSFDGVLPIADNEIPPKLVKGN